jgi:hypothetical protein
MKAIWAVYLAAAIGFTSLYVWAEIVGSEPPSYAYARIEPSVRTSPGSAGASGVARGSGGFWHSGFHGGK